MWKFIDISSSNNIFLYIQNETIVIKKNDKKTYISLKDLNSVVISGFGYTYSNSFIVKCLENYVPIVFCSSKYMPLGVLTSNFVHNEFSNRLHIQVNATKPTIKQLWARIVKEKIKNQGDTLKIMGNDKGANKLYAMSGNVLSGDWENMEAICARYFFSNFLGQDFRREPEASDIDNISLNYGYTVMRAIMTRAIMSRGLHPAFALKHSHKNNPFALVDDMMEILRPLVDRVWHVNRNNFLKEVELSPDLKMIFTSLLEKRVDIDGNSYKLVYALGKYVDSYIESLEKREDCLLIPKYYD